jgi:hypothetical protein
LQNVQTSGESERALRPMTIGRKNWLFFGSEEGGKAMGTIFHSELLSFVGNVPVNYENSIIGQIAIIPTSIKR